MPPKCIHLRARSVRHLHFDELRKERRVCSSSEDMKSSRTSRPGIASRPCFTAFPDRIEEDRAELFPLWLGGDKCCDILA